MTKSDEAIKRAVTNEMAKTEHEDLDIAAIRAIAGRYIEAAHKGEGAIFTMDVLPTMRIQGYLKGQFIDITANEFFAYIDQTGPAKELEAEIQEIEVIGTAANLRLDCKDWHGVHYSDFMNLLKIAGSWKIAGKVFDAHENR